MSAFQCCLCGFASNNRRLFMCHYKNLLMCQSQRKCCARQDAAYEAQQHALRGTQSDV